MIDSWLFSSLVTPGLDEGEVIAQVEVPILNNDTEDDLAAEF
ncbi:MAG: hypothetical protein R3A13_10180 [Bdellovibrionota bacterium]